MKTKHKCEICGAKIVHKAYFHTKLVCKRCSNQYKAFGEITKDYIKTRKNEGTWKRKYIKTV